MNNTIPPHRLVMIHKAYPPHVGGIERHLQELSESLAERGWMVSVLVCNDARFETNERIHGVQIIRVPQWGKIASQPLATHYFQRLRAMQPDILHVHVPFPLGWYAAMRVPCSLPVVCTWHSDIIRQKWLMKFLSPLEQRFLRRCNRIIATSESLLNNSKILQPHRERCRVIPLTIPPPEENSTLSDYWVDQYQKKYPGKRILFVGRLVEYKGLPYLLEAMVSIPATLLIAGDGPLRSSLKKSIASLPYRDRIHLLGQVTEAQKQALYRTAEVLILPSISRNEAFGYVVLEAFWQGCPVISTHLPTGVSWVNQHQESGLVVPPADSEALAQAIHLLLSEESLRARLSIGAHNRAKILFSYDSMITSTEQLYRELLNTLVNPIRS